MGKILSVTGHRPARLPFKYNENHPAYFVLKEIIRNTFISLINNDDVTEIHTGMAIGTDQICTAIAQELRDNDGFNIKVKAALPCRNQDNKWPQNSRDRYRILLEKCDGEPYCASEVYNSWCMDKRNKHLVDTADMILAVWDGELNGGTANTIRYSLEQKRRIIWINPITLDIQELTSLYYAR